MKATILCLATLSIFAGGCGRAAFTAEPATTAAAHQAAAAKTATATGMTETAAADEHALSPGDFVVYKVSGSFRKTPMTLTQRVIAREGDATITSVTTDDGKIKREMRVKTSDAPAHKNEILAVWKIEGAKETPSTVEAYEQLLASATVAADSNDAVLGTEDVKLAVGKDTVDAKRTSFRVRVGKKHGTLRTLESGTFAWGDLGGEITIDGGKVLYKAEVVDAGHAEPAARPGTAIATDE